MSDAMAMMVLLPALFFLLVMAAAASRCGLRQGFVVATVVHTLCVVGATELLSAPAILRLPQVTAFWAIATILAAIWLWRWGDGHALRRRLRSAGTRSAGRRLELAGVAVVLVAVFLLGVSSPPNNWESMAYRMTRVVMWMQQSSVEHYATPYLPQLYHSPLISWHALHLHLLAGGDRFANSVEWLGLVGCGIAASLIARELRAPFRAQVLAAVLATTLPVAVLQGSSTQGNVLAAYWLLCAALLFVQHLRRPAWWRLACCGAAVGFAVLAKPTMYVIGPPVALALGLYGAIACRRPKRTALALVAVLALAATMNLGHYARNWQVFGHPISPPGQEDHVNQRFGVDVLAANLVRNSLLHWGLPSAKFNESLLAAAADLLGGIPDLPEVSQGLPLAQAGIQGRFNEMHAANFLHYWLLAVSAVGLACWRKRALPSTRAALCTYLLAAWTLGIVTFSGALEWERWNTRYDVGLFMLGCPLAATFLAAALRARRRMQDRCMRTVAWLFLAASCPHFLLKESAPVLKLDFDYETLPAETVFAATRTQAYFNHLGGPPYYLTFAALTDAIAELQPEVVGLYRAYKWPFDYPLYVLLKERLPEVRMSYYDVWNNTSASLASADEELPDVVVKAYAGRRPAAGENTVYETHLTHTNGVVVLRRKE